MNKEHLALRNNFRVTKKFLIAKFDCILLKIVAFVQMTRIDRIFEDKFGLVYFIIAGNDRIPKT